MPVKFSPVQPYTPHSVVPLHFGPTGGWVGQRPERLMPIGVAAAGMGRPRKLKAKIERRVLMGVRSILLVYMYVVGGAVK